MDVKLNTICPSRNKLLYALVPVNTPQGENFFKK